MIIFVSDRVENVVGKGENAYYQHFLLFPQCCQRTFYLGLLKSGLWGKELKQIEMQMNFCPTDSGSHHARGEYCVTELRTVCRYTE